MSGTSHSFVGGKQLTVAALLDLLRDVPGHLWVEAPSLNRCPGKFIQADHVFIDTKDGYISIDGDIGE